MWARLLACLIVAAIGGCGDDAATSGAGANGGSGGRAPLPDDVLAVDVGKVEHLAVASGKVYFQTTALDYFVIEADGPQRIAKSALGPGGFAVRNGVVYYAHDLFIARFDGASNDKTWRDYVAIAAEVDDDYLYIANCDGVGRLPLEGDVAEGLVPGCFVTVGATQARVWAQNETKAVAVRKAASGEAIDVIALTGLTSIKLVGTDDTGAYFPSNDTFPLIRVDDDGTSTAIAGDGEHVSLVDGVVSTSRYRVARRGETTYALARRTAGETDGVILRLPRDGSAATTVAPFRSEIATLAIDDTYLYYVDAGSIVRRPLD